MGIAGGTILLLGCGRMGRAMLRGWLGDARHPPIAVIDPKASSLRSDFPKTVDFFPDIAAAQNSGLRAAIAVLAIKPQQCAAALPQLTVVLASAPLVLSIAAGVTTARIKNLLGLPGAKIARAMPNLPAAIGQGISGLYCPPDWDARQQTRAKNLLTGLGLIAPVPAEADLDAVTAMSGSGPAYVFYLCEAMTQAGIAQGLPAELAARLARQTIIGSAALLAAQDIPPETLRQAVTSPGGTTEAAIAVLAGREFSSIMAAAIAAAAKRSRVLAET